MTEAHRQSSHSLVCLSKTFEVGEERTQQSFLLHDSMMRIPLQRLSREVLSIGQIPMSRVRFMSANPMEAIDAPAPETRVPPPHPTQFLSPKVEELYFQLISLQLDELKEISKVVMLRVGIDIEKEMAARKAFIAAGGNAQKQAAVEEAPVEVKTSFDLKLVGFDASAKIKVIKEVRAAANLGLKEAKELVESAPKIIRKGMKEEEAQELMKKLMEVGAVVEIV